MSRPSAYFDMEVPNIVGNCFSCGYLVRLGLRQWVRSEKVQKEKCPELCSEKCSELLQNLKIVRAFVSWETATTKN